MKYFDYVQYIEPVIDPSQQHSVLYQENYFIIIYMKKNSFTKSLPLLDASKKKYQFLNSLGIFFSQYSNFLFFPPKYGIYYYL